MAAQDASQLVEERFGPVLDALALWAATPDGDPDIHEVESALLGAFIEYKAGPSPSIPAVEG